MSPVERRQALLEVLCRRRSDTYANLAFEFGVSKKTIQRDVEILICSYPIETVRGRFGGGVRVLDDFPYDNPIRKRTLNAEQVALLEELKNQLTGKKLGILNNILAQFAP